MKSAHPTPGLRLPTLFLSHGSPMTALQPREAGTFFRALGPALDKAFGRPRAVLVLSAHTLAREPVLLAGARHHAVYDFGGFDPELRTLRYDAPGAPALADRVQGLLARAGHRVHRSEDGGLDHGIWTPLRYIYPDADVPVLPLAFVPTWTPQQLFQWGQALAPLADEGVLIIGSGSLTHNLRLVFGGAEPPAIDAPEIAESAAFRQWVQARVAAGDTQALLHYRSQAPHAAFMHPSDEHWLPWYPAWGAAAAGATVAASQAAEPADRAGRDAPAQPPPLATSQVEPGPQGIRLHASLTFACLAMDAYAFGPQAARIHLPL